MASYSISPALSSSPQQTLPLAAASSQGRGPRQRSIRACQTCRARRIKCDNNRPKCSACEKSGTDCVQNDVGNALTLDPGSQKILQRIDDLENVLKSFLNSAPVPSRTASQNDQANRLCLTTEKLLSWSVFRGHYDSRRDLKALLQGTPDHQASKSPSSTDSSFFLSREAGSVSCRRLLDRFFNFVHVKNPMLDEAKVRQMVHRLSLEGPTWDAESCLALLVCAIGAIASSFDISGFSQLDAQSMTTAQSYFSAAQRRISLINGNGGVLEAHCHFYSGVYLMTLLQPLRAWRHFTQALACCQEFTCANPNYNDHSTNSDSGLSRVGLPEEESLYWSCWKSERELRVYLDLPDFAFNNLSYPLLFPTPPISMAEDQAIAWYFYLSEISLLRLEHRVRDEIKTVLNAEGPSLVDDLARSTRTVEGFAEEWLQSLPPVMNLFTPQKDDDVLKFILRGHFLNLWEIIYWPWLDILLEKRLHLPGVNMYVVKGLQIGIDRIRINKPGFRHRHHGTWLMVQSCTRSALTLLAAKHSADGSSLVPDGWREAVSDTMDLLRFWQHDAPDAANRLYILEELFANVSQV